MYLQSSIFFFGGGGKGGGGGNHIYLYFSLFLIDCSGNAQGVLHHYITFTVYEKIQVN